MTTTTNITTTTTTLSSAIALEIASAYAGTDYGKARLLDGIRGGYDLGELKAAVFFEASVMARLGKPGFEMNRDGTLYTKKGKGKSLSNDFSMARTAMTVCLPEQGESLSGWYARATTLAGKKAGLKTEAQTPETKTPETKTPETKTPETKTPETKTPETRKPIPEPKGSKDPKPTNMIKEGVTAPIDHGAPMEPQAPTGFDLGEFLALCDKELSDDQVVQAIAGLQDILARRKALRETATKPKTKKAK